MTRSKLLVAMAAASLIVLFSSMDSALAKWSVEPGSEVRNAFGVQAGTRAHQCPGACGAGCPDSCEKSVSYECTDANQMWRVVTYTCGTHQGCRTHDDCLDACLASGAVGGGCQTQCDQKAVQTHGMDAVSWLQGGGPYDGQVSYQYTRDAADAAEPTYRCPEGSQTQCGDTASCVAANGASVEPMFASYAGATGGLRISDFRSGPACGESVCAPAVDVRVTGADACSQGDCSRFGMEFDYANADPSAPLECSTSTSGGGDDFIGGLIKLGADAHVTRADPSTMDGQGQDGMQELLGLFSKVIASADSPEDLQVSMAPLDEQGKPIESQRVGSTPRGVAPPIPSQIELPAASGHLFVPMYQLKSGMKPGQVKERRVLCTHKGTPVLETVFRLHPA